MDIKAFFESFLDRAMHAIYVPTGFAMVPERGQRAVAFVKDGYKAYEPPQQRPEVPGRRYVFDDVESFASFLSASSAKLDAYKGCVVAMHGENLSDEVLEAVQGEALHYFTPQNTEILGRSGSLTAISRVAHERHEAKLALAFDDAWRFWVGLNGGEFTVAQLRRLLRQRRSDLLDKGAASALESVAVNIASGVEIKTDPKSGLVVFKGAQKNVEVSGSVPDSITLAIPVYAGQPVQKVVIDLVPRIDSKTEDPEQRLTLTVSIVDVDTVKTEAWKERVAKVRELLGPEWLVGLGAIDFEKV